MVKQRTLKNTIRATGIGLHTGYDIQLTLKPAPVDTGIVFYRTDTTPPTRIDVRAESVSDTRLSTTLENHGVKIGTVEHLLSALSGVGVDNVVVELDTHEVPIMDGSAAPFVYLLRTAGIKEQEAPKRFIRIVRPIEVSEEDKWARFEPYDGFKVTFSIDFDHPIMRDTAQCAEIDFSRASYDSEISNARTFGFVRDLESLKEQGLAQGASVENAIGLDEHQVLNEEGLRHPDEFVKHKILDAIGDLYVAGHSILGHFSAHKSGHALNNKLLRALLDESSAWEWCEDIPAKTAPIVYASA